MFTSTGSAAPPICSAPADRCSPISLGPEQKAAIQPNLAQSKHHNINLLFKIKHSVSAQNSQKETNTSSSINPLVRNTSCYVKTHACNCGREYVIIAGTPRSRDSNCLAVLRHGGKKPVRIAKPDRSRSAADTYPVVFAGKTPAC